LWRVDIFHYVITAGTLKDLRDILAGIVDLFSAVALWAGLCRGGMLGMVFEGVLDALEVVGEGLVAWRM